MPWKNGKGQTIELLKEETGDDNDFAWRLSKAQVSSDGGFSEFAGYERTLVLLSGDGMTLEHEDSPRHVLTEPLQFARFDGAEETIATLHNGPITDFNIMTKKSCCRATITAGSCANNIAPDHYFDQLLVYCVSANLMVSPKNEDVFELPAEHLLQVRSCEIDISLSGGPFIAAGIRYV